MLLSTRVEARTQRGIAREERERGNIEWEGDRR